MVTKKKKLALSEETFLQLESKEIKKICGGDNKQPLCPTPIQVGCDYCCCQTTQCQDRLCQPAHPGGCPLW